MGESISDMSVCVCMLQAPLPVPVLDAMDNKYGMSAQPNTDVKSK